MCVQCVCSSLKGHSCELDFFFFFFFLSEQTTHERGQMTVTFSPKWLWCDLTSKHWLGQMLFPVWEEESDYDEDIYLLGGMIIWLYHIYLHVCVCVRSHFCLCIRWKPPISQAYQNGQSTSSWLRLWDWLLLPAWTAKHPKTDPGLACHSNRCGKISTYEPYTPLM